METNATRERKRVLVSAYACNPRFGSEAGIGWGWCKAISCHHDLSIITDAKHRDAIEGELARHPDLRERMSFYYVPRTRLLPLEKLWPPSYFWTYDAWQCNMFAVAAELHKAARFDIAHQLTYMAFRSPGWLWKLDIPFIWGPIGGLENTPWQLLPAMGPKGAIHFAGRNVINSLHKRFLPGAKRAFRKARGGIIAGSEGIRREILRWYGHQSEVICEIGLPPALAVGPPVRESGEPLRLAWSGLHIPRKALPLLLHATAHLPTDVPWELDILGKGPCTLKWQRFARRLGVAGRCRWHGWLPREEALSVVRGAHLFVITSIQDLTSTVLVEALAQGLPVICPDHCGFSDVVTADCGIKLPIDSLGRFQAELTRAIARLVGDEPERRQLAAGAIRRAADFSWERKAEAVDRIYRRVLAEAAGEAGQTEPVVIATEE